MFTNMVSFWQLKDTCPQFTVKYVVLMFFKEKVLLFHYVKFSNHSNLHNHEQLLFIVLQQANKH